MPLKMCCRCGALVANAYEWKAQTLKLCECEFGAAQGKTTKKVRNGLLQSLEDL
ncbi:hypothetical protein M5D96_006097 [Drosophila gunungcola]|uniref:Uncharacterized protein n=1 Tax=Drosophila gunungcola TaxID=103775 RepID=A0A9P9YS85_9MUSC|nr:hypothetical protein M5D96_006097 [Drosophila gunungcola]